MESTTLEVAIGLAIVFLLVTTFVTAANEAFTRLLNVRSKALWATLETLLTTAEEDTRKRVNLGFLASIFSPNGRRPTVPPTPDEPAAEVTPQPANVGLDVLRVEVPRGDGAGDLTSTPSIWSLEYAKANGRTKVWSIPASVFTGALLELAVIKGSGDTTQSKVQTLARRYEGSPLGQYLGSLPNEVVSDLNTFSEHVSAWFDGQMQRLTDSYRRLTRYLLAAIGLLAALAFNLDAIAIASGLATNADQRQAALLLADDIDASGLPCPEKNGSGGTHESNRGKRSNGGSERITDKGRDKPGADERARGRRDDQPGETGADATDLACAANNLATIENLGIRYPSRGWTDSWKADNDPGAVLGHVLGLLLTALAVGLGGPFWFDTIGALAGLRRQQN